MRRNCLLWRRICLPHERMDEGLGSAKNVGEHVETGDGVLIGQVGTWTLTAADKLLPDGHTHV